ncbi:hypothetical protein J2Y45_000539 [Dyadobacter sp. BE34]|uniref:Uncharacterized protein n=1 Tax=Dyadobacter fermentans TaxID=94254 RepID=A0ABU1QQ51_9BACT|nr:hypothetical protein [Dyadobacter fermentans]MDR7041010.1 hypothetical protein [Dyadobacter sp. BE242]MDR7195413.1 hypothetical protein [Dyadobacter sp. BE34]MDR7214042.1 hypothetical protein [Dyadobacter sp. BE31]MDR7260820.1 hypothetical protein [Dyadobacter sp. BE32]
MISYYYVMIKSYNGAQNEDIFTQFAIQILKREV